MIYETSGCIDYQEAGAGPTVVLVPGSCSTGAAWRPVMSHWQNQFRCVTTSLLGYGGTAERRASDDADIAYQSEILEAVIRRAGCPVHLVGHSFGGLAALAVALRGRVSLLSLTIAEALAMEILRAAGEMQHYDAFRKMSGAYSDAFKGGETNAIARMVDFYGGAGTFAAWPQRVRDYAIETTPANLLDWESAYGFRLTPAALATVKIPTLVVWGEISHPAVRQANDLLGRCIPDAVRTTIAGAAHFMIATHAKQVADLVARHVGLGESDPGKSSLHGPPRASSRAAYSCVADWLDVTASAHQSDDGRDHKQDHSDKEDRLGDFDGSAGNAAEAQNTRDQRDDQKRNDPAQHDTTSIGCCSHDAGH